MKKYCLWLIACIAVFSCAKDNVWLDESNVEKGKIIGQLINKDNDLPFQGVKILFERQVERNGEHAKIDTVSTDSEGKFSYAIPFPNKVRVVIQDTGRYTADTVSVLVEDKEDYLVDLATSPRFGINQIVVNVFDTYNEGEALNAPVSLWVRQSVNESYSLVDTLYTNEDGQVIFENIAWPVEYKVKIADNSDRYDQDSISGVIRSKDVVNIHLNTSKLFGDATPVIIKPIDSDNPSTQLSNLAFIISYSSPEDGTLVTKRIVSGSNGLATVSLPYPINANIVLEENNFFFPIDIDTTIVRGNNRFELLLNGIPEVATLNVNFSGGIQVAGTVFNVYQKSPNEGSYTLLGVYSADLLGKLSIPDIYYPKTIKIENKYNRGYLSNFSEVISVPSYRTVNVDWTFESSDKYMLFGQPSTTARAQLDFANLGIYNDPSIFGTAAQASGNLTFQIKVKISVKGTYNPAIGGTVTHYNANEGGATEGFGFMHGGHGNSQYQWRFKYGRSMISSNNSAALTDGEWVALTAVIHKTGATTRTVTLYTNGELAGSTFNLPSDRTAVVTSTTAHMLFGGNPNQYGAGNIAHYIKDFRIYTRALSLTEIQNYCNDFVSSAGLDDLTLIGYWPMNDGATGQFRNYSKDSRAAGKDIVITTSKALTIVPRKCN